MSRSITLFCSLLLLTSFAQGLPTPQNNSPFGQNGKGPVQLESLKPEEMMKAFDSHPSSWQVSFGSLTYTLDLSSAAFTKNKDVFTFTGQGDEGLLGPKGPLGNWTLSFIHPKDVQFVFHPLKVPDETPTVMLAGIGLIVLGGLGLLKKRLA